MSEKIIHRTLIPVFDQLRSNRVLLRPYQPEDATALFEAVNESRAQLDPWIGFSQGHTSVEQSKDWINQKKARWILREEFATGIWEITTGRFLGDCSLKPQDWEVPTFSIGYWLRTSATGKGFMTEAVKMVTTFAFNSFNARRVVIACDETNTSSVAIAKRLEFELEARLRNDRLGMDKTLRNTLIFARITE